MTKIKYLIRIFVFISTLFATWFDSIPRIITQPNGETIDCFITGDQFARRLHDSKNFTIIMNHNDGYYYYAIVGFNEELLPSTVKVGHGNPEEFGISPGLSISLEQYNQNKEFYKNPDSERVSRDAPTSGELAQINVFIRFADDPTFPQPRSYYNAVFQSDEDVPSLRHYYWEVSYNTLLINTFHFPGSIGDLNTAYQDEHNRSYYQPQSGNNPDGYPDSNERTNREHTLLANALNSIASDVSPLMDIDANDDGYIDAVSFVIYGEPGDWAELLWPHRWSLYSQTVTINGAQVGDYLFMLSESWYFNVGVLCHEFFHVLGAPDLYHYDGGDAPSPVGGWDVMEANTNPPQYPSAFMKYKYGDWLPDLPEIIEGGTYTLNPLQLQDNAIYKIASPNSDSEYFVVEYRKQEGLYESNLPGNRSGLVAYRINTNAGNGNASGPPDEIYCYRPGGTLENDGNFELAPYNSSNNHTQLNDDTNPECFLYSDGNGADGGLNLYNVTEAGETISFTISFGNPVISVDPDELNFILDAGINGNQSITISNSGEAETVLNYEVNLTGSVPFENPQGGPDGGGYFWSTSTDDLGLDYEWINIEGLATQVIFPHNDQFGSSPIELPFEFEFYGVDYNYVEVNANGWIGWNSSNETTWLNEDIPSLNAPRPAIFGFFDDLNPENSNGNSNSQGNVYYHVNIDRVVIWFNDIVRWNTTNWGLYDFQIVLFSNGSFQTNYRDMSGVLNSSTVGFQNEEGTEGTQIIANENYISSNFTWAASSSNVEVPWVFLSSNEGDLSGSLVGNETDDIYVQVITTEMESGSYGATINITSYDADAVAIPINLTITGDVTTPTLPYIDISSSEDGIIALPENVDPLFSAVANRYTHIVTPNGDLIQILIQDDFTVHQILHSKHVLESYLTNIPESVWGNDKTTLSNAISASNAILFLLNDEDEYENPNLWALMDSGVRGQDLLATEVFPEGSAAYMNSSERDATYEEVLHFVHGYGIQLANPAMQIQIEEAMANAISNEIYNPLNDLPLDDYDEEYLAMGLECYFGLWAHNPNGDGYCGDQEYAFITRDSMEDGDPDLFEIIEGFFGETWEYSADLPGNFENNFYLNYQSDLNYTNRSQFLKNVILNGENSLSIYGNEYSNVFIGNDENTHFQGYGEDDYFYGGEGQNDRAMFVGNQQEYVVIPPFASNDSSYQIIDIVPARDGIDHLFNIEEVEFNGVVYTLNELLGVDSSILPDEYALYSPYPNPFNPTTSIKFDLVKTGKAYLSIFDLIGNEVRVLESGILNRGQYVKNWDAKNNDGQFVSTGVYFIKLSTESYKKTIKVLYLK
jgi:M6 family metalloprotease-like protein